MLSDRISTLIFALIVVAVLVYLVMSGYVVGPFAKLRKAEKIVLVVSVVGIAGVVVYAAFELLLHVVF